MTCKHRLDRKGWCKNCGEFIGRKKPTFFRLVAVSTDSQTASNGKS